MITNHNCKELLCYPFMIKESSVSLNRPELPSLPAFPHTSPEQTSKKTLWFRPSNHGWILLTQTTAVIDLPKEWWRLPEQLLILKLKLYVGGSIGLEKIWYWSLIGKESKVVPECLRWWRWPQWWSDPGRWWNTRCPSAGTPESVQFYWGCLKSHLVKDYVELCLKYRFPSFYKAPLHHHPDFLIEFLDPWRVFGES